MKFNVDYSAFRDGELIETLQELYLNLGYFNIHGEFPKPTAGISLFCVNLNPNGDKEYCEGCSLEKVTFEEESFCFHMGHTEERILIPAVEKLIAGLEKTIRERGIADID